MSWAGFDSTCDFIRRSHAALTEQIAQLATRIDALGDAPARAQPQDVVHRRPTDQQNRHLVGYAADGELDYDAPKQHPFVARPAGALSGQHMVVIRLVMLFAFNMMMVVLGISNCPYLRSRVIVDRKIIWSGRCAWIRFLHPIITVKAETSTCCN